MICQNHLRLIHKRGFRRILTWLIGTLIGAFLCLWGGQIGQSRFLPSANAQFVQPAAVATRVYQSLPTLPQENNYINQETGEVDTNNTLVSRLISYHLYVKSRPPNFRLDWKLTLADYLGAHEQLVETQYPGYNVLQENPMKRDRAIIDSLSRSERNELIQVLVSIFNPEAANTPPPSSQTPSEPVVPPQNRQTPPSLPQPGDAQLLMP